MINDLNPFVGIYMQEMGQKYVFFIKENTLILNGFGGQFALQAISGEVDSFFCQEHKLKIKFNRTQQGFCHFIDLHHPDRHSIAVRQFPRGGLDELLRIGRNDIVIISILAVLGFSIFYFLSHYK